MTHHDLPAPRLPRAFYDRDTEQVARDLVGCRLMQRRSDGTLSSARIVETEGYLGPHDLACHTARGRTPRTEVMFGAPGHVYVYMVYGMHFCLNFVTEPAGHGSAVLIRALEPAPEPVLAPVLAPASEPEIHRGRGSVRPRLDGPARLTKALGISLAHNGLDLVEGDALWVLPPDRPVDALSAGPRVGVGYAGEWALRPLRFWETGSPWVSPVGGARVPRRAKT